MKTWLKMIAVTASVAAFALVAPTTAQAAPYCGITWGSLDRSAGSLSTDPLINVRAGRHDCYDRLVMDFDGSAAGYTVRYVSSVPAQGSGNSIALRGGAFLEIALEAPAYDANGNPDVHPGQRQGTGQHQRLSDVSTGLLGRQFRGYTTIGLGVRARLPFRVFTLAGPGDRSRLVIDVAHQW
ncbi:MAG: hypothetical protein WKF47_03280 [Geodermatophilaceae bacterium]